MTRLRKAKIYTFVEAQAILQYKFTITAGLLAYSRGGEPFLANVPKYKK